MLDGCIFSPSIETPCQASRNAGDLNRHPNWPTNNYLQLHFGLRPFLCTSANRPSTRLDSTEESNLTELTYLIVSPSPLLFTSQKPVRPLCATVPRFGDFFRLANQESGFSDIT